MACQTNVCNPPFNWNVMAREASYRLINNYALMTAASSACITQLQLSRYPHSYMLTPAPLACHHSGFSALAHFRLPGF